MFNRRCEEGKYNASAVRSSCPIEGDRQNPSLHFAKRALKKTAYIPTIYMLYTVVHSVVDT